MTRSRVVAVAGAKGSPGVTFVALGLAGRLAAGGLPTLLVDADAEAPAVAAWLDLAPQPAAGLDEFGPPSPAGIAAAARPAAGLALLDLGAPELAGRPILDAARQRFAAIVVDLGHQPGRLQRELAAGADWLLWVALPDRLSVERADRALGEARLAAAATALVVNRRGSGPADAGAVLGRRHEAPIAARLPERPRAAREAVRRCLPPDRMRAFGGEFAQLARCVHPDAGVRGGVAWP